MPQQTTESSVCRAERGITASRLLHEAIAELMEQGKK